jgi:oxygen-independent coproporphyrinogen III oxidase
VTGGPAPGHAGQSLYIHVPFCARACPYCDFDFVVGARPDVSTFFTVLAREVEARVGSERPAVRTVYVGGGTPSMLDPAQLGHLAAFVRARFDVGAVEEWTVELNPEHVDDARLLALRDGGVDRVSLGVQSLRPGALRQLGRVHDDTRALQALRAAADHGLRVSADVIVGWPGQGEAELRDDLVRVLSTGVEHVSIYALTIEPGTPWEALVRRGQRASVDGDRQADLLSAAEAILHAEGFSHYEVASYARPGAQARHNLGYWSFRDVIALGPSAASVRHHRDGSLSRRTNARGFDRWAADPQHASEEHLGPARAAAEALWLGLRRLDGLALGELRARFPAADEAFVAARTRAAQARGLIVRQGDEIALAPGRWLWHDEVGVSVLLPADADERGQR